MPEGSDFDDLEWGFIPDQAPVKFNSAEHADIPSESRIPTGNGDERFSGKYDDFRLYTWPYDEKIVPAFQLDGETKVSYLDKHGKRIGITFSKALALAGDFFCNKPPTDTICFGKGLEGQQRRFDGAIQDMIDDPTGIAPGMESYLSDEVAMIEKFVADMPRPGDEDFVKAGDPRNPENKGAQNIVQAYATGGEGVASNPATFGKVGIIYGTILTNNMDHFGKDAWTTYKAGHSLALRFAKEGKGDVEKLKKAYLYDAFALHYLTDQFASGHIRTARTEFNYPSYLLSGLQVANFVSGLLPSFLNISCAAWDKTTNILHDTDGAIGLRVTNKRGESWITYGDKQYFAEPNRVNRLRSIECAQASIDEVYAAWRDGQYPQSAVDQNGNISSDDKKLETFAALQIAPIYTYSSIDQNHDATGNAAQLWIVERNNDQPDIRDNKIFGGNVDTSKADKEIQNQSAANEAKGKEMDTLGPATDSKVPPDFPPPPPGQNYAIDSGSSRISGTKSQSNSENGYFFARRSNVEVCSLAQYQWAWPGYTWWGAPPGVSYDVSTIEKSYFVTQDLTPKATKPVEVLSGGFVQIQEYINSKRQVNYAANVWGPVQTPIRFLHEDEIKKRQGRAWTDQELDDGARQMTFTFRGRRTALSSTPEIATDTKNYRWLSWAEPGQSGKTSLLKFTHCIKDIDASKQNAITVEAWSMIDPDPMTNQQWTQYESLKKAPEGLIFGGPSDKESSVNDFSKTVLVSNLTPGYYERYAHMTRFFIFPFRQGSNPSNPDIIIVSWKGDDPTKAQCIISVASTESLLTKPTLKITTQPQIVDGSVVKPLSGFLKRFEDVNNKPVLLHARATEQGAANGLKVLPQIYYQDGTSDSIVSKNDSLQMVMKSTPAAGDNYQILVGDTKYSGHREMVVVGGHFPDLYLSAWELKDLTWEETTPSLQAPIPYASGWEKQSTKTTWANTVTEHRICTFIPNQPTKNGLNVLLVSTKDATINFRVYIKDGEAPPATTPGQTPQTSGAAQPNTTKAPFTPQTLPVSLPPNQTQAYSWQWVIVSWNDNVTSIIPSWVFIPPLESKDNVIQTPSPPAISDKSPLGSFGDNSNLNNFAKTPVPGPNYDSPWDMAMVTCPSVKPGSLITAPKPSFIGVDQSTHREKYGRFEAITTEMSGYIRTTLQKQSDGSWKGFDQDGKATIISYKEEDTDTMTGIQVDNCPIALNIDLSLPDDDNILLTRYGFDATSKKPTAVMYIKYGSNVEVQILNPEVLFQKAREVTVPAPSSTSQAATIPAPANPNTIPTAPRSVPSQPRPKSGWSGYVDCTITDEFYTNLHFKKMGWRLVKMMSVAGGQEIYGVMNVFSFHGMLGVRVWAPAEPGRWHQWISRGFTPYMGQTSLGTGWNAYGHWNENAAELSWGACEDFQDFNLWHGHITKGTFWNSIERGWADPVTQKDKPYYRGYESKMPDWPANK